MIIGSRTASNPNFWVTKNKKASKMSFFLLLMCVFWIIYFRSIFAGETHKLGTEGVPNPKKQKSKYRKNLSHWDLGII